MSQPQPTPSVSSTTTTTTTPTTTMSMSGSSSTQPAPPSIFSEAKRLASINDVASLTHLLSTTSSTDRQHVVDMALIGGSENKCSDACRWALVNGACELWGIQQPPNLWGRVGNDTNKRLRMLGGPGEVAKGSFASSSLK